MTKTLLSCKPNTTKTGYIVKVQIGEKSDNVVAIYRYNGGKKQVMKRIGV